MASRKNRSRKANRKSPQLPPGLGERLRQRLEGLFAWFHARRWVAIVVGALLLFGGSLAGGYWLAERLEGTDSDRLARDTLEEMKRGSAPGSVTVGPKYARIEDLPDLPKYTEVEPGQPRPTLEEKPRAKPKAARVRGHELMLHLPMEPNGRNDPGPNALLVSLSDAELRQRTTAALDSFDGFAGVNNHMGSRFTAFKPGMETVLRQFKGRGLMFLDSRTSAQSVGDQLAQEVGVPSIVRHVFLDDDESLDAVRKKLAEAEVIARRQGFVVVIGHPHEATLQALGEWLPGVQGKGLALAPATAVLRKRNGWD